MSVRELLSEQLRQFGYEVALSEARLRMQDAHAVAELEATDRDVEALVRSQGELWGLDSQDDIVGEICSLIFEMVDSGGPGPVELAVRRRGQHLSIVRTSSVPVPWTTEPGEGSTWVANP